MVSNSDHSYEYSYFSDGQRLSKDVDGKKTVYIYNAGMLLAQETDEYRLNFYYDADGLVTEIGYQEKENGNYSKETYYFYTRNGQGDIIGIYRCSDSTLVGTYEYDLWGNPVSKTENVFTTTIKKKEVTIRDEQGILDKNPLRYRGYYYDEETGFYYLNARYYDPKVHRFISADSQIAGVSSDVNGFNLFAYCDNDPVNKIDDSGMWPQMSNEQKIGCGLAIVATIALAAGIAAIAPELGISACALQTVFIAAVAGQAFCSVAIGAISAGIAYMNGADADEIWQAAYDSAADAFLGGTIIGGAVAAIAGGIGATACFLAGTPVNAENGKVPIENIKPGDIVLSEDPETGDGEYKRVIEVYINESTELVHLIIDDEEIITTPSHPFYVKDRGFVPAGELSEHSVLVDSEGNELHLQTVRWEHLQSPIPVYNFAVEDYHTYFVGDNEVLVHNMCAADIVEGANAVQNAGENISKSQTPDQKALFDISKEAVQQAKNGNPISYEEAKILDEWATEYGVPQHHQAYIGSGLHFPGGNFMNHTHIYRFHVPFRN
nr:polymorphic toxin-type HINT domain-containing protein [uncultured Butyrivibrio sp.]